MTSDANQLAEAMESDIGAQPEGPPDRSHEHFGRLADGNVRRVAHQEYQRTLEEFRQTGRVKPRERQDFAHLTNPSGVHHIAFMAHAEALDEIERWQEEQEQACDPSAPAKSGVGADEEEPGDTPAQMRALSLEGEPERQSGQKQKVSRVEGNLAPAVQPRAVLLRGVAFDPVPSRVNQYDSRVPRLDIAETPERLPSAEAETEARLNALIGECHFLMREVAFRSICQADVLEDRRLWTNTAMELAKTGATVAEGVARLRHGSAVKETHHTTTVIQNRVSANALAGGGGEALS